MARPELIETITDVTRWIAFTEGRESERHETQLNINHKQERDMKDLGRRVSVLERKMAVIVVVSALLGSRAGTLLGKLWT